MSLGAHLNAVFKFSNALHSEMLTDQNIDKMTLLFNQILNNKREPTSKKAISFNQLERTILSQAKDELIGLIHKSEKGRHLAKAVEAFIEDLDQSVERYNISLRGSFHNLSDELIVKIAKRLDPRSQVRFQRVNSIFYRILSETKILNSIVGSWELYNRKEYLMVFLEKYGEKIKQINPAYLKRTFSFDDCDLSKVVEYCPNLESIKFSNNNITNRGLSGLKTLKNLTSVTFWQIFTSIGLDHMVDIINLKSLKLENCSIGNESGSSLAGLAKLKSLQIYQCKKIHNINFRACTSLESLVLNSEKIASLAFLTALKNLKNLELRCKEMAEVEFRRIGAISTLENLDLCFNPNLTDSALKDIVKATNIRSLKLGICQNITDAGIQHLAALPALEVLDLSANDNIKNIRNIAALPNLKSLNLSQYTYIHDSGNSSNQMITDEEPNELHKSDKSFQHLGRLNNLEMLNLARLGNLNDLSFLTNLMSMRSLNLAGCENLTDKDLVQIAELKNLKDLNLSYCNKITNVGIGHLTSLENLEIIDLTSCYELTNDCLVAIAALTRLKSLTINEGKKITLQGTKEFLPDFYLTSPFVISSTLVRHTGSSSSLS